MSGTLFFRTSFSLKTPHIAKREMAELRRQSDRPLDSSLKSPKDSLNKAQMTIFDTNSP